MPRDLARLWRIPLNQETDQTKIETALQERIKELNCLYGVARLAELHSDSVEDLLHDLVNFLPLSWQYPEIACARIQFQGRTYKGHGFVLTSWRQASRVFMFEEPVGEVAIFYREERPAADEGPFLKEERALLDALAERIGTIAGRIAAEKELHEINRQLTVERKALQEANLALRTVLARIEEEKHEVYLNVKLNVDKVIIPILHALTLELSEPQREYAEMIRRSLNELTSPFVGHLTDACGALTPTEISICNMIRSGLRSKEIARLRGVSTATVHRQREHIRKKLKIANQGINLTAFLQSNIWHEKE
ncbi:MAG: helix-turn-helix transcriptional regulator [Proteobacteria bacterium]|nr:helix-turn-helix transcriptional regulator [Pseudomonadota bacterium]